MPACTRCMPLLGTDSLGASIAPVNENISVWEMSWSARTCHARMAPGLGSLDFHVDETLRGMYLQSRFAGDGRECMQRSKRRKPTDLLSHVCLFFCESRVVARSVQEGNSMCLLLFDVWL